MIQEKTKIFEQRKISNNAGSTNGIDKESEFFQLVYKSNIINNKYVNSYMNNNCDMSFLFIILRKS